MRSKKVILVLDVNDPLPGEIGTYVTAGDIYECTLLDRIIFSIRDWLTPAKVEREPFQPSFQTILSVATALHGTKRSTLLKQLFGNKQFGRVDLAIPHDEPVDAAVV